MHIQVWSVAALLIQLAATQCDFSLKSTVHVVHQECQTQLNY